MKTISDSVNEIDPKVKDTWVLTLRTSLLHVDVLGFEGENILLFLGDKTGDFTSSEHTVDAFKEALVLDLTVSHDEGDLFTSGTSLSIEVLDVFLQLVLTIGLG